MTMSRAKPASRLTRVRPLKMAELRIIPPPLPEVVPDAGGWTIGSDVAYADGTGGAASRGLASGLVLSAISAP